MIGCLGALQQMGKLHWRDFRLWGADVTPEQQRNNLIGLAAIGAVLAVRALFAIYD